MFENLANSLNITYNKVEKKVLISKSMQKALEEEKNGEVTKLFNHKNAVAEIIGLLKILLYRFNNFINNNIGSNPFGFGFEVFDNSMS